MSTVGVWWICKEGRSEVFLRLRLSDLPPPWEIYLLAFRICANFRIMLGNVGVCALAVLHGYLPHENPPPP